MGFLVLNKDFSEAVYHNEAALETLRINLLEEDSPSKEAIARKLFLLLTTHLKEPQYFSLDSLKLPKGAQSFVFPLEDNNLVEVCIEPLQSKKEMLYFVLLKQLSESMANPSAEQGNAIELHSAVASFLEFSQETIWVVDILNILT